MKKNKFIVFEGLDACGKSTISKRFAQENQMVLMGALPSEIKSWLPKIASTHAPEATFSYFTLCNLLRAAEINESLQNGKGIVLDRFYYTSFSYHKALLNGSLPESIKKVYNFESLPKPDLVIFLDVPQHVRQSRIQERGGELQWYGDKVSMETDLTSTYFRLFEDLGVNVLRVDNHKNTVEQTMQIINTAFEELISAESINESELMPNFLP
ncbi:MAG: deoxynucleoside kinase [Bacteroidia bacterium]|nr:deoxynucleoside kinase [Bacteroidia bacterium]